MKYLVLAVALVALVGCNSFPKFDVTTPDGHNYAITDNKVSYYNKDGFQVTCNKEADLWDCSYVDDKGLVIKLDDIDASVLEEVGK
jgi:hypothetical protein